jgi:flagellar hook-associated protein 2
VSTIGSGTGITFGGLSGFDSEPIVKRLMQIEARPLKRLQAEQTAIRDKLTVIQQVKSLLLSLQTSAKSFDLSGGLVSYTGKSSDETVATLTPTTSSLPGNYNITVTQLAQAQKVRTDPQQDLSSALNIAGKLVVNGRVIDVVSTDSLLSLIQKINAANGGALASALDGGSGSAYFSILSSSTGTQNALQVADLTGNVATTLGLVSGAPAVRRQIGSDTIESYKFSSSTENVASMMGTTGAPTGSVSINGQTVTLDFNNDSLQQIADRINATPGVNATATVVSKTEGSSISYTLQIKGNSGLPPITDTNGLFEAIGFYQRSFKNQQAAASDAQYTIDNIPCTSSSNVVTDRIPNSTLTLLKAGSATLDIMMDTQAAVSKAKNFVQQYNNLIDFIRTNSSFDKETYEAGPLFQESNVIQLENQLTSLIMGTPIGATGQFKTFMQVGITRGEDGKLTLDEGAFAANYEADPEGVQALFSTTVRSTNGNLIYVSSGTLTKSSTDLGYSINITQAATQSSFLAGTVQTAPNSDSETLTFNGALFGNQAHTFTISAGSTLSTTINAINNDSYLKERVIASNNGGSLQITSKRYGTNGDFTVVSNLAAANDNSGLGTGGSGTYTAGVDVAGTINGEAATGDGQFLKGNAGNPNTTDLQVQYKGNTLGLIGSLVFSKGIATQIADLTSSLTDITSGIFATTIDALKKQDSDYSESIQSYEERLKLREEDLRRRFLTTEEMLNKFNMQSMKLGSILSTLGSSSTSNARSKG